MNVPIVEYTEEYRNKHWRKCRFGRDLRNCGEWVEENGMLIYKVGYYSKKIGDKYVIFCERDNERCDCEWTGDRD